MAVVNYNHNKILKKHASIDSGSQFKIINGKKLHFRVEGNGPALLMIPGTLDTLHTYDAVVPLLKDNFTLIRVDVPGLGFSEALQWNELFFLDQINESLHELITQLGYQEYNIIGNSLGGLLAWTHALKYPNNTNKIILLDPAAYEQKIPWFLDVSNPLVEVFLTLFSGVLPLKQSLKMLSVIDKGIVGPNNNHYFISNQIERITEIFQTEVNVSSYLEFLKLYVSYEFIDSYYIKDLKEKDVLLIFGANDTVVPVYEQLPLWNNDLPNINTFLIPGGGHVPHWERPELVAQKVLEFIN